MPRYDRVADPQWRRMHALMSAFTPLSRSDWLDIATQLLKPDEPFVTRNQFGPQDVRRMVDAIEGYLIIAHTMREARRDTIGPAMERLLAADKYRVANGDYEGVENPQTAALVSALLDLVTAYRVDEIQLVSGRRVTRGRH